jgi:hypothetical protein
MLGANNDIRREYRFRFCVRYRDPLTPPPIIKQTLQFNMGMISNKQKC